ncbi:PA0069 family radical SAM protein [Aliiroseovarius sp. F47248L]|uniref:PA0069 family radical SAM protein n=1 Tax=Aliiroseovarius sp. F47248L TaxID=2926420 RepID=UPI001FF6337C|nr:PA0069 family radical SAM protein [Aliiroseovarius sp. F47248L]MCK0138902.1 PA0069 family radical SAM protein [Aliiroseovarius sp. F47248L]
MVSNCDNKIRAEARRGRAANSNDTGRFEPYQRVCVDDGWQQELPRTILTHVAIENPRSVITRNRSPDISFDRSINPYRGCEHGCIYCFARPTHAYLGYSAGLDFETRLIARPNAPRRLEKELSRARYAVAPIAIGTNTDPYQPIEAQYRVMRGVLEVLARFRHPVTIVTKGTLIERDLDLLSEMAQAGLTHVGVSVTTMDAALSRKMEPRVPSPKRRLQMIERLSETGIPVRVMVAPVVPGLTDHELEAILCAARDAGAEAASYILLRLPSEVSELFQDWLTEHVPDRAARVMGRMREMRGGDDYDAEFGSRMVGKGTFSDLLRLRFDIARKRLGLSKGLPKLRCDLFAVPPKAGDQLSLF